MELKPRIVYCVEGVVEVILYCHREENIVIYMLIPDMVRLGMLLFIFLALVNIGSVQLYKNSETSNVCKFTTTANGKKYSFNLAGPIRDYPYGVINENRFYKIIDNINKGKKTYWFQLYQPMKFNYNPPYCENCGDCGGQGHCSESCSALISSSYHETSKQFHVCNILGYPKSLHYSLIDHE